MENFSTKRTTLWAHCILLIAALLRLFSLNSLPPGLAQDEVLNADIVERIRAGNHALFFREGFGHEPLFHYFATPFQALLGDNFLSIRLPSFVLGMLVVALTIVWARRWFGSLVGLIAGLGVATSWWAIVFSRVGIRPLMETFFLLLAVLAWEKRPILTGLLLGLTLYTYSAALVLFALPIGLLLYGLATRNSRITSLTSTLIPFFIMGLLFLPLYLTWRNDPTLLERARQLSGPLDDLRKGNIQPLLSNVWLTLTTFFFNGSPRWTYGIPHKPLLGIIPALFFTIGLISSLTKFRQEKVGFLLIWFFVALLPSILTPQAPSMIRLIAAIPPTFALVGLGVRSVERGVRSFFIPHPSSFILLFLATNLFHASQVGFYRWANTAEAHDKYQTIWADIGRYHHTTNPATTPVIIDASYAPIDADSLRRNLGYDPNARWAQTANGGALILPVTESNLLYVPEFAPLDIELLATKPIFRSTTQPSFTVFNLPKTNNTTEATFANIVHFQGVKHLSSHSLLTLWQLASPTQDNLSIFVHIIDEEGNIVAQHDGFDAAVETLQVGDAIIQRHVLAPHPAATTIRIGLYNRDTGQRYQHNAKSPSDFLEFPLQ